MYLPSAAHYITATFISLTFGRLSRILACKTAGRLFWANAKYGCLSDACRGGLLAVEFFLKPLRPEFWTLSQDVGTIIFMAWVEVSILAAL